MTHVDTIEPENVSNRLLEQWTDRVHKRELRIGVIGLGQVGLQLGATFAESGFTVLGFDVDRHRVASINAGVSYIADVSTSRVAQVVNAGLLAATTAMHRLAGVDAICICVPTPLSKVRAPDVSQVVSASDHVSRALRRGQLVVLESTTYPGTTRDVILPLLEESGLRAGDDFFLAYSPERIDPGNRQYGIGNTPKVLGGIDASSTALAALLYEQAIETVVTVSSPEAAEMVKLLENTYRSVNIALANEVALMCDRLQLDVWEVIAAAATKPFGFAPFFPGPGIGGHCIPSDPYYLSWKMETLDYRARLIELAGEINAEMPQHVVRKIAAALNDDGRSIAGASILVLGVAYKADVDDARESPALDVISLVQQRGAHVAYADPHVPSVSTDAGDLESVPLTAELLARADCVVIATNHRVFDYDLVVRHARIVVDTRNALAHTRKGAARVVRL